MQYISYQYRWIQVSTEETLKTIRRLEIRELLTHMRNDFDGFIYRCDTEKEIISELEHVSVKTLQTKRQSETMVKRKKNRISEKFGMISKGLGQHRKHIKNQDHTKVHKVKGMFFLVVRYRCENWTIKKAEH